MVNVATRLRGTASRFYRSCTTRQRSSYAELVAALRKRFTPVHIQSVHSGIFHERKQCTNESVDEYAQDLHKLFHRAYSSAQGGGEAEVMGRSVLSNQFVAGLVDRLKTKMVGRTGTFEELLAQARFEEARLKNIPSNQDGPRPSHPDRKRVVSPQSKPEDEDTPPSTQQQQQRPSRTSRGCFSCGGDPLQEDILEEMPSLGDSQRPVRTPQDTQLSSTPGRGDRHPTGNSASATWTGRLRSRGASSRTS